MARTESDREDLLREAATFAERIEWTIPGEREPVVAGRAASGQFAVYFGQECFYRFDREGGLRRAFAGGDLYRSEGRTLARLTRVRTEQATALVRNDLDDAALRDFLTAMQSRLRHLLHALDHRLAKTERVVGEESSVTARLTDCLRLAADNCRLSPPIGPR